MKKKPNKTDAGKGSKATRRVSNVLRSPSPDPKRSAKTMIATAQEFLALMRSTDPVDYERFRHDSAPIEVWRELISRYSLANVDRVSPD